VLDRVQALMTLLEGHGNLVMDALGARHVHGQARMSEALKARRQQGGLTRQIFKALGLEMKMRQYEVGERFCLAVTDLAGPRAIDAAWHGPEHLPTLAELNEPAAWLARVDAAVPSSAR
jgi:putative hydrolase